MKNLSLSKGIPLSQYNEFKKHEENKYEDTLKNIFTPENAIFGLASLNGIIISFIR